VRSRVDTDLDACERLIRVVHDADGYPRFIPKDLRGFIAATDSYQAWVAEHDGDIVGHVALHREGSSEMLGMASDVLELPANRLGIVARLFTSSAVRRQGVGRSLLQVAAGHAVSLGLWPILDVVDYHQAAIRLYEACGWRRAGSISVRFEGGNVLDEFVYLAPYPGGIGES